MHRNVQRVQEALCAAGLDKEVLELSASTRTSAEAAAALGVEIGRIAKSLVFVVDGEPVVVVLSGVDRLDTDKLRTVLGGGAVERADPETVRSATGFPIGGVSPVGHGARVLVDRALARDEVIWAAAGTPNAVYPTTFDELVTVSGAEVADLRADPKVSGAKRS
jgi:prolyl-tRNA editing enzyme YbaK/EbsC (Cys-tRNA(Pro) deacylase)